MAKELNENTTFKLSIKTIIGLVIGISTLMAMWFTLKAEIDVAKTLPEPEITKIEYELKDELIRNTIMNTQDDVEEIKDDIKLIKIKLYEN